MKRIGDDDAGFTVEFDPGVGAVRVRGWGFWNTTVSEAFANVVAEVCGASPHGSSLLLDMSALRPLREEGQKAFGRIMGQLRDFGVERVAVETSSHLVRLQLLRLATEHGALSALQFTGAGVSERSHGERVQKARPIR